MDTAAPAPPYRWQRLRAALTAALRASRVELIDSGGAGRDRGELVTHVAIALHQDLSARVPAPPADHRDGGDNMKRSTKRLLVGVAAGLAVYHFAIARKP